jgi:hypothetical protein
MIEFRVSKILCYVFSLTFFLFGFYLILVPSHLVNFIGELGIQTGVHSEIKPFDEILFWRILSFAYMMTIAFLAFLIAANITIYWRFLLVLFVAKIASSLSALGFFLSGGSILTFAIFISDFPLSILFLGLYIWIRSRRG